MVTIPREFCPDAPATLMTVSDKKKGPGGPLLIPYPSWEWHNTSNCNGFMSITRVYVSINIFCPSGFSYLTVRYYLNDQ